MLFTSNEIAAALKLMARITEGDKDYNPLALDGKRERRSMEGISPRSKKIFYGKVETNR